MEEASRRNKMTDEMAEYLADENNPIDVKAEIITILGIDQPVNIPKTGVKSKGKIYGISAFVLLILAFTVKYILHKKSKKKD